MTDFEVQVPAEHYGDGYDSPARLASYNEQIALTLERSVVGDKLLEVGVGNGTVSRSLRAHGRRVTTVDFDEALKPEIVADIRELPFLDNRFNGALAFEVLEHLPWEDVRKALKELRRVAIWSLVSVPNVGPAFSLRAQLPNGAHLFRMMLRRELPIRDAAWALTQREAWRRQGGSVERVAAVTPLHAQQNIFDGQHHWVLGESGLEAKDFVELCMFSGLNVARDFRPASHPSHHFFVLERL
jgi:hypothetical protein